MATNIIERTDEKRPIRAHIEHKEGCEFTVDFLKRLEETVPDARVTTEIGEGECFEFFINEKCVYSRRLLYNNAWPDVDMMMEISTQMDQGRSFMHMYLCTFMHFPPGEVIMIKEDKKKTPLAKRIVLSCTIQ